MTFPHHLRVVAVVFGALALLTSACTIDSEIVSSSGQAQSSEDEFDDDEFGDDEYGGDEYGGDEYDEDEYDDESSPEGSAAVAGNDASPTRNDIDCSEDGLGEDGTVDFTVAHYVIDGNLGAVCFGDVNEQLVAAWQTLATITPPDQLRDLGLFGGFESLEGGDETTLAFVNTLDDAGSLFQMSINLPAGEDDPDELALTMAHEFSHVFTATSPQIDRFSDPDACDTFFNGEGCYLPGSVMAEWISLFWGGGLIDQIDPYEEATGAAGEQRCALDAGFFGPYAASNPEEDFAEAFSAYVFQLEPDSPEQQQRLDWIDNQPGLAEFRDRAVQAGLGPLPNLFDYCG